MCVTQILQIELIEKNYNDANHCLNYHQQIKWKTSQALSYTGITIPHHTHDRLTLKWHSRSYGFTLELAHFAYIYVYICIYICVCDDRYMQNEK
jgi:hypothetical protein